MAYRLLALALTLLLLTSCGGNLLVGGMEDLLRPPTLNRRQAEVSKALEETLNLSDIVYVYPQDGEYRSPFIFYDLNGNGQDEAVVFYAYADKTREVRAKVMAQDGEGGWSAIHDIPGSGDQINFVEFASLIAPQAPCMIIGWQETGRQESILGVYSMEEGRVNPEIEQKYLAYSLADHVGNQMAQLVVVSQENRGDPYQVLLFGGQGRHIALQDAIPLHNEVSTVLQVTRGSLWDGNTAVYIDEVLDNAAVATEIIRVLNGSLELVAGGRDGEESQTWSYYVETFRPDRVPSVDINGDGQVEIPQLVPYPDAEEGDEITPLMLTQYRRMTREGLQTVFYAAVNESAGYLVFFPDKWLGEVTLVAYPELNEWRFFRLDPDSRAPSTGLLRVLVYSTRENQQPYSGDYFLLETKGAFQYYGYLPTGADEDLAITEAEARSMFSLLAG